jgi:hypothetical protein
MSSSIRFDKIHMASSMVLHFVSLSLHHVKSQQQMVSNLHKYVIAVGRPHIVVTAKSLGQPWYSVCVKVWVSDATAQVPIKHFLCKALLQLHTRPRADSTSTLFISQV